MKKIFFVSSILISNLSFSQQNRIEFNNDCIITAEYTDKKNLYNRFKGYFNDVVDAFGVDAEDYNVKLKFTDGKVASSNLDKESNERTIFINADLISIKSTNNNVLDSTLEIRLSYEILAHEFTHHFFKDDPSFFDKVKESRADFFSGFIVRRLLVNEKRDSLFSVVFLEKGKEAEMRKKNFKFGFNRRRIFETASTTDKKDFVNKIKSINSLIEEKDKNIGINQSKLKSYKVVNEYIKSKPDTFDVKSEFLKNDFLTTHKNYFSKVEDFVNFDTTKALLQINTLHSEKLELDTEKGIIYSTEYISKTKIDKDFCSRFKPKCNKNSMIFEFELISCKLNLDDKPTVSFSIENQPIEYYRNIKLFQSTEPSFPNYFKILEDKYLLDACGGLWLQNPTPSDNIPSKIFIKFQN